MAGISRRRLFTGSAGLAALLRARRAAAQSAQDAVEPWKVLGRVPSAIGQRAPSSRVA